MNLERMGIPSVVVVVEQFVTAARASARALGMPDISMLVVPQDYLGEDRADVQAVLEPRVSELLDKLFVASDLAS